MSGLFGSASSTSTTSGANATGDISRDITLTAPPEDGISELAFSSQSEHLAVASWDKKVRIYEINDKGQSEGKAMFEHEGPVLSCCWSKVSLPLKPTPLRASRLICITGWNQSCRSWRRQSSPYDRSRLRQYRCNPSSSARATDTMLAIRRCRKLERTSPSHRLLGQDH